MAAKPTYEELEQRVKKLEHLVEKEVRFPLIYERTPVPYQSLDKNGHLIEVNEAWLDVFREIANQIPGMVHQFVLHPDGSFTVPFISDRVYEYSGYKPEEIMKEPTRLFGPIHPEDFDSIQMRIAESAKNLNEFTAEHRITRPDGEIRWFQVRASPRPLRDGDVLWSGISIDITERKRAEETLGAERDLMERVTETSPAGITRVDSDGNVIYANKRAEEILGIRLSKTSGRTYDDPAWKITDFEGRPFPNENLPFNLVRQTGCTAYGIQHAIEWPNGRRVLLSINAAPLFDNHRKYEGMVATIEDITEKYEAEQKYQMLFREMIDGFALHEIIRDEQGRPIDYRFLVVNPAFERQSGLKSESLIGKTALEVLPNLEHSWIEKYGQVALTGEPVSFENYSRELDRHFQVTAFRPARNQFACIFVDITEIKKLEAQLRQSQKLEAVGTLAGGIAHDFNNILSPILIHTEMVLMDIPGGSPIRHNLQQVYKAGERARDLVKQILAFSRQSKPEQTSFNVTPIVKEALKLLRSSLPTTIEIRQTINACKDIVLADPTQIHQILMNMCTNASHAMREKGGVLEVDLSDVTLDADAASLIHGLKAGDYLRLDVRDTGHGIESAVVDKIFDPFFTTKKVGEGTGMGLALIHGIVTDLGGAVTVESEPGKGSAFHVYIPVHKEAAPLKSVDEIKLPLGSECILIVDDEEAMIAAVKPMLEGLGYKVTAGTSSMEALEAFHNHPDKFDLLITDMTMPNMTGDELAAEVMGIRPDIPIILCTGFSEKIDESKAKMMGISAFVMKPIIMKEMAKTIREVLDKSKGGSRYRQ